MRILLIEDEQEVSDFVKQALVEEGYGVDDVDSGPAGEKMALSQPYDLLILDIMLPKKDGLNVLKSLRQNGLQTPILLLTALSEAHDRVVGLDAGADDYLGKPFALAELRARVRSLTRRQFSDKSVVLKSHELEIDTVSKESRLKGQRLELTTREYTILEYLLRNKNRLLSKGMIAEHVWDFHFSGDYNIIEVYVRRLRKKTEIEGMPRLIHTIRNSGYVLRDPE